MSFIAVGGTLLAGSAVTAGTIAAGAGLAGAGLSLYGQNKQNQANQAAQNQNIAQQEKQNDSSWTNWLMTRGVAPNPGGSFTSGRLPGPGESRAVNTRLPLWANVRIAPPAAAAAGPRKSFLISKG